MSLSGNVAALATRIAQEFKSVRQSLKDAKPIEPTGVPATDRSAIQSRIDAGAREVRLAEGTFTLNAPLVLRTGVHLRGAGMATTILRPANGSNIDLVKTENFDVLTGTHNGHLSPTTFTVSDMTLEGNKVNNTSGRGMAIYGRDFVLENLRVYNFAGTGVWTEWADQSDIVGYVGVNDAMECEMHNIKSHDNGGWGFDIQGPHDGFGHILVGYTNGLGNFRFHRNAHGFLARTCHAWGEVPVSVSIEQNGVQWELGDAETTGAGRVCMAVMANDVRVSGKLWDPGGSPTIGLQVGDATRSASALHAEILTTGCTGGSISFVNSGGSNWIKGMSWLTSGELLIGNPAATDVIDLPAPNGGVVPNWVGRGGGHLVRDVISANYTRHRIRLPDPGASPAWYKLGTWDAKWEGSRLTMQIVGTGGYNANNATNGKIDVVVSTGNGASPNIIGYFRGDGMASTPAVTQFKAVATDGNGAGGRWDIYGLVSSYTGNSYISVETGTDQYPNTWEWKLTSAAAPGADSATIKTFTAMGSIAEYATASPGSGTLVGTVALRGGTGDVTGYLPVYNAAPPAGGGGGGSAVQDFEPGAVGGGRRYVRLATIDGVWQDGGASVNIMISGTGDIGSPNRGTLLVHFGQRGANGVFVRSWGFGVDDTWSPVTLHTVRISDFVYELWGWFAEWNFAHSALVLNKQGNVVINLNGATATAPAGLSAAYPLEEVSSLQLGTTATTAMAGNKTFTAAEVGAAPVSHTHTASNISDSTTVGRAVITAADAAAARTAIGASNLVIGTTASTAKAGDYQPAAANISDSTTVGRSVLTATDAAAARTAIGAGTSNLIIGTTSTTAKAGDYAPPAATTGATGLIQLAGMLGGTATSPTVRAATDALTGVVELATTAEATTGTATNLAVTPAGLKTVADTKAPLLVPTTTKTAAYTVAANELAVMNVAGGATVLTLPAAPADRERVGFRAVGSTTTTPLTIQRGGTATIGESGATSVTEPLGGVTRTYQFDLANNRWLPVTDVKPLGSLDARYNSFYPTVVKAVAGVYPARPSGAVMVIWVGTTDPGTASVNGDMWVQA